MCFLSTFAITMLIELLINILALTNVSLAEMLYIISLFIWYMFAPIIYLWACRWYRKRYRLSFITAVIIVVLTNMVNILKMDKFSGFKSLLNFIMTGTGDEVMLILPFILVMSNLMILLFSHYILNQQTD